MSRQASLIACVAASLALLLPSLSIAQCSGGGKGGGSRTAGSMPPFGQRFPGQTTQYPSQLLLQQLRQQQGVPQQQLMLQQRLQQQLVQQQLVQQQLMQQQLLQQRQNLSQGQSQPIALTQQSSPLQPYQQQALAYQQQQAITYQQQYMQALQAQMAQQTNAALQQAAAYSDPTVRWAAAQEISRRQSQYSGN